MKTVIVDRYWTDENQSSGACMVLNEEGIPEFTSLSLERGWRDNQNMISCLIEGEYDLVYEYSAKFDRFLWEIKGTPGRSECKFHSANFWKQLNGCIALGLKLKDIDNDGYYDITNSRNTMKAFHQVLKRETNVKLIIKNSF
jgi:hypothetical protein